MLRKFVFAFVVMAFSVGVLSAAEMIGIITKVEGNKITFKEGKKGEDKKFEFGAEKTYTVAKDAKIMKGGVTMFGKGKGKGPEATPLEGGLTNELLKDVGEKGRFAQITTNDSGVVTEIRVAVFGGKKGGKKKDNGQ